MDDDVLSAMARWPNVPAVFGWLSLTARGQWRLHPNGDGTDGLPGQSISNPQILQFIARNYQGDELGRWYFQNGPQRVFVRLDAAPLVISVDESSGSFTTHIGQPIHTIDRWWITDLGNLYVQTDRGPGMIIDRDLAWLVDRLQTSVNDPLSQWWMDSAQSHTCVHIPDSPFQCCAEATVLTRLPANDDIAQVMGFMANPSAPSAP